MQCAACKFENPQGNRFCGGCGARLQLVCHACGEEVPESHKFCGHCGASQETTEQDLAPRTERRQLTVMFCDLVGSTELSGKLDPEELRRLIVSYQDTTTHAVEQFDGHVAQHLGDGLLIYFGYPRAHEDDARRAVAAGLSVLAAVANLNQKLGSEQQLQVRVGVHTGPVVTGAIGAGDRREELAVGQTPNIAARLESIADADTVVISGTTRDLASPTFEYMSLGQHALKGVSESVEVFRVVREVVCP